MPHQNTILGLVHEYGVVDNFISFAVTRWVAYEGKNFSGEQYILEKGVYRNCEDWGATSCQIASVQPVLQVRSRRLSSLPATSDIMSRNARSKSSSNNFLWILLHLHIALLVI